MAKKSKDVEAAPAIAEGPRPRLVKLIIKNFRCIGATPVTIELDDIVVLVGPNNVGKKLCFKGLRSHHVGGLNRRASHS